MSTIKCKITPEEQIEKFCRQEFPNHEAKLIIDEGDILIYYLRYVGEGFNNFAEKDIHIYYNTWYPGEFNVSVLEPVYQVNKVWQDRNNQNRIK